MPAFAILQHRHAFSLYGLRHDHARQRVAVSPAFFESFNDVHIIVPVDSEGKPSECPEFFRKTIDVEPIHRMLALAQSIHVDHGVQV